MIKINSLQKKILSKIKFYLKKTKSNKIDTARSSFCYFNTYSETPGFALTNLWINNINILSYLIYILKNIYSIFYLSNYKISNITNREYENVIITWGKFNDFKNRNFKDNFSNSFSNSYKQTLFFVIYLDFKEPKFIPNNVVLLSKERQKFNIYFFFKKLINIFYLNNFSIRKFFHYFSYQTILADEILKNFLRICNLKKIKKIIMPYEAQPYQNLIFKELKNKNKNIKTIGFVHSMIPALPINFIKRDGAPEILFLTGKAQLNIFIKLLNWKKSNLRIIYSPRIKKDINKKNLNSIFFPISINNNKFIIKAFENFILSKKDYYFNKIKVKKHPSSFANKDQNYLKNKINEILSKNKKKFSKDSKNVLNFFIGPTSAFIQYLENNLSCIHITNNPVFDIYTYELWKKIKPKQIKKNVFIYNLVNKNKMILPKNNNENYLLKKIL